MSDDFLSKFSKNSYDPTTLNKEEVESKLISDKDSSLLKEENVVASNNIKEEEKNEINIAVEEVEVIDEKYTPKHAAETNPQLQNNNSRYIEHDIDIDYDYRKKKKRNKIIAIASSVVAVLLIVFIVIMMNLVTIKNVQNLNIAEVKSWAKSNDIELKIDYVFSVDKDENTVISQSTKPDSKVWKGATLKLKVSKGANPEELVKIPDLSTMNVDQINEWIKKNKLDNVNIVKSFSNDIEVNKVISFTYEEGITAENFKRKNRLDIVVSKGKEVFEKNIDMKDFVNKSKPEVEEWSKSTGVQVTFTESSSDTVPSGSVISQSVPAATKISKADIITVVISTGKVTKVPNFYGIYKENAATDYPGLVVTVKEQYSETAGYGDLISQSIKAGTYVKEPENAITLVYSVGQPYIDDLSEMKEKDLPKYFYDYKALGANIKYQIEYTAGDAQQKGTIYSVSKSNEYIGMNETIYIKIYR